MSHFVGIAFIPRDSNYTVNEDYSKEEQNLENMFSMGSAVYSSYLDDLLAPYNEQNEEYCEVNPELNDEATEVYQAYINKDYETVDKVMNARIEKAKGWYEKSSRYDDELKKSVALSVVEVDEKLEPYLMLSRLFNQDMTTENFDMNNNEHKELFTECFMSTDEWSVNENNQIFDHYYYNEQGYYDWYEVGGRWDNYFSQDNYNNVLEDISLLKGTRMVKRLHTLDWYLTLGIKDEDIENRNLDNKIVKTFAKDDNGEFITTTEVDDEGNEKEVRLIDEYYTTEELLDEEVEIKKYGFLSMVTEQYGWEQESTMGWFGMSEKDGMSDEDRERTERTWTDLVDDRVDELLKDVDENGVCKWVAVAVDYHI